MPLTEAHALSHVVKDRLMARYPQIADAVIHIEPPPPPRERLRRARTARPRADCRCTADWDDAVRRVRAAEDARGAMRRRSRRCVTERDQAGDGFAVIGNAWSRSMFDGLFYVSPPASRRCLPSANLVFVQSRDGNTVTARSVVARRRRGRQAPDLRRAVARRGRRGARRLAHDPRAATLVLSVWRPELVALRAAMDLPRHPVQIVATLHGARARRGAAVQRAGAARDPDHRRRAAPTRCATR